MLKESRILVVAKSLRQKIQSCVVIPILKSLEPCQKQQATYIQSFLKVKIDPLNNNNSIYRVHKPKKA